MQDQEVEVSFCDLCGTSVPAADLEAGTAMRHEGRTIGACCLVPLRAGGAKPVPPPGVVPGAAPAAGGGGAGAGGARVDNGRLLTVAIVLLVGFAAGVMFLDGRLSSLGDSLHSAQQIAQERRKSDSEVLMDVAMRVESVPAKADVEALRARADAIDTSLSSLRMAADERAKSFDAEVQALRKEVLSAASKIIDYRPLLEDLRQRQVRLSEELRDTSRKLAEASAGPPAPAVPTSDESAAAAPPADLPAELVEQIEKLKAADEAVRFGAVDLLTESGDMKVLPYLLPMTKDDDAFVRRLTVEGLARFKAPETIDALIDALADDDNYVCETAWRSLRDLTGQKFPFDVKASKEARARAAERWREWWEKARATFG